MRPHSGAEGTPISCRPRPIAISEGSVEPDLRQKEPAQSVSGFIQRRRGSLNVVRACQTDEAVPKILTLQQYEDHEDDYNAGRCERRDQRSNYGH